MREKGQAFLFIQEYQLSSELPVVFGRACWICLWIFCTEDFSFSLHRCCEDFMEKEALWTGVMEIKFWQCTEKSLEGYFWNR